MPRADRGRAGLAAFLCLVVLAAMATATVTWGADVARRVPWLKVERVEVSGAWLLTPQEVLVASGIRRGQHLLDERGTWEKALREHPVIAEARVTRRPPSTLRVSIVEKSPVAFVLDGSLRPATGRGEILPIDPSKVPLDLPVLRGPSNDSTDQGTLHRMLAETQHITELAPELIGEISEIHPFSEEGEALVLIHPIGEIIMPFGATARRVSELRAVLADLPSRWGESGTDFGRSRLDLRFADQVVVRNPSTDGTS
ncbi:MAG: FtsQ-type POTRA domain-containing protein [Gemmatimonas sp.]|nr:FtsQ-type POTRA domain-containing protein [Gemmatimonas sp.]